MAGAVICAGVDLHPRVVPGEAGGSGPADGVRRGRFNKHPRAGVVRSGVFSVNKERPPTLHACSSLTADLAQKIRPAVSTAYAPGRALAGSL